MYYFLFSPRLLRHLKRLAPCFVGALTRPNDDRLSGPAGRHPRRGLPSSQPPSLSLSAPIFTFFHSFSLFPGGPVVGVPENRQRSLVLIRLGRHGVEHVEWSGYFRIAVLGEPVPSAPGVPRGRPVRPRSAGLQDHHRHRWCRSGSRSARDTKAFAEEDTEGKFGRSSDRAARSGMGGSARGRKALPAFPVRAGRVLPSLASRVSEGERKKNLE